MHKDQGELRLDLSGKRGSDLERNARPEARGIADGLRAAAKSRGIIESDALTLGNK